MPPIAGLDEQALRNRCGQPLAARMAWLLAAFAVDGADPAESDVRAVLGAAYASPAQLALFLRMVAFWRGRLGGFHVLETIESTPERVELVLGDARERRWRLAMRPEGPDDTRIGFYGLWRELPPGLRIREATAEDAESLEEVERESPIVRSDGTRVAILRGRGYFDQMRLMERCLAFLAEDEERPVAFDAIAIHPARVLGHDVSVGYRHHTRVTQRYQRLGLNEALIAYRQERIFRDAPVRAGYVYVDPGNDVIRNWSPTPAWKLRPLRALLRCETLLVAGAGRPATAADLEPAAAWLNALHEGEELYLPYDAARLQARLARLPDQYGLAQLRIGAGAVAGVWDARERIVHDGSPDARGSRRAWVLDYGLARDADPSALQALLHDCCVAAGRRGITHLSLFLHEASRAAGVVRAMAESIVPIEFQSTLPEPDDVARRGLYVDHVYW